MISTDYNIEALRILLDKSCLSERYYPLLPYTDALLSGLPLLGCRKKSDAEKLSDETLAQIGMTAPETLRLFRRFLTIYDVNPQKFKEIPKLCTDEDEQAAFRELYCLPGVKYVRAALYYRSGYRSIAAFTDTTVEEALERTARTIAENGLSCIVPLPKEVRTHIAVAKAFTGI